MGKRVLLGMSGGVDSSVAALVLQRQGYEVVGVTFRLWKPPVDSGLGASTCCSQDDIQDARRVCQTLGIPHYVFNYEQLFLDGVVDPFVDAYRRGLTPNPCVDCNRSVKFGAFLQRADELDFDYISTGHYAKVEQDPVTGRYRLLRSEHDRKDQSYVLYSLTQRQLSRLVLPLAPYDKEEVRAMAAEAGLEIAKKPDSQDICFIPDGDYASFLHTYAGLEDQPGDFVDEAGQVLGRHPGFWRYTIGQRKGLGLSLGRPMFVKAIDPATGQVTLAEEDALYRRELVAADLNWIEFEQLTAPLEVRAKVRYSAKPAPAVVTPLEDGRVQVVFREPQRAITPGQAVVFYSRNNGIVTDTDSVLGGGIIQP